MPVDPILSALPALANLIATPGRGEAPPVRAQVLSLPAPLMGAPSPVSVSGVVAESPIPGQLRVATAFGEMQLHTPTELPPGRAVTVITRPNLPTEVFLLPNAAPAPGSKPPVPAGAPLQTGASAHAAATSQPAPLPATSGQPPATTAPAPAGRLPATPLVGHSPAGGHSAGAGQNAVVGTAPAANPPATPTFAPIDPRGTAALAARPTAVPAQGPHAPTLSPQALVATFDVAVMPERASAAAYAPPMTAPPSDLLALFTDLRRLVAARDPKAADRLLRRLPTADSAGALALLALPVAARRDELAAWLGRDIAKLVQEESDGGRGDLIERITAGLARANERQDDGSEHSWRWRQLPMVESGQFVPVQVGVAVPREQPEPDADGKRRPMRIVEFAVEAALSALGLTRVEATYHQRRLDLVVQCETPIEQEGREQIVAAVARVFEEFGLGGSCRFEPYRAAPGTAGAVKI